MKRILDQLFRTRFTQASPTLSESEQYSQAFTRATEARAFLSSDIIAPAYQGMLDRLVDELLTTPVDQPAKILVAHAKAQALVGLVLQMRVFINELEVLDARREKQRAKDNTDNA